MTRPPIDQLPDLLRGRVEECGKDPLLTTSAEAIETLQEIVSHWRRRADNAEAKAEILRLQLDQAKRHLHRAQGKLP